MGKKWVMWGVLAGALLALGSVQAQDDEAGWDGKKLFMRKSCLACHGKDGSKAIQAYPNLAGLDKVYLANQMQDIASGKRDASPDATGHPRTKGMKDVMHLVNAEQMKKMADFLSSLPGAGPLPPKEPLDPAKVAKGDELYKKLNCKNCHGAEGKKPLPAHPSLAGQKRDYLALQMKDLRDGVRKNGKSNTMTAFIKKATDDDIERLADYLSQVSPAAK